jgi:peptidoglycan/xylan/chitin deacetylase (PgdA/CDA1 family)
MYHYVREFNTSQPYLHFLDINDFKRQLKFFKNEIGFVTREEFCDVLAGKIRVDELDGKILLTFDDALSCHYDYVFRTLVEHDLFGVFFVSTKPFVYLKLLDVHKIHCLTSTYSSEGLYQLIEIAKKWEHFDQEAFRNHRIDVYKMQQNLSGVHEFKFMLNYCMPSELRGELLDFLANEIGTQWDVKEFYLKESQMIEMQKEGMIFGSHTHSHPMMSTLSFEKQLHEIKQSKDILCDILDTEIELYCHPYGGKLSYNKETQTALKQNGMKFAFDVNARNVTDEDLALNEMFIPRFDCNMFPHGKSYLSR